MGTLCEDLFTNFSSLKKKVLYLCLSLVIITVSTILNGTVLYIIKKKRRLHQPSFYLIAALSFSDLCVGLFGGTCFMLANVVEKSSKCYLESAAFFITTFFTANTTLLLCVITYDRYSCIANVKSLGMHTNKRKVKIQIIVCFVISSLTAMTHILDRCYITIALKLLTLLIVTCFIFIGIYCWRLRKALSNYYKKKQHFKNLAGGLLKGINRSVLLLVLSFAVFLFPMVCVMAILIVFHATSKHPPSIPTYFVWCCTIGFLNSVFDPVIYAFRCDVIGKEIRKLLRKAKTRVLNVL